MNKVLSVFLCAIVSLTACQAVTHDTVTATPTAIEIIPNLPTVSPTPTPFQPISNTPVIVDPYIHFPQWVVNNFWVWAEENPNNSLLDQLWYFALDGGFQGAFPSCPSQIGFYANMRMAFEAVERLLPSEDEFIAIRVEDVNWITAQGGAQIPAQTGIVIVRDDDVTEILLVLMGTDRIDVCIDQEGLVTVYGPGIQDFLNWLGTKVQQEE